MTDLEIAKAAALRPIDDIAARAGLTPDEYEPYGHGRAKLRGVPKRDHKGKLVLVTAMTPTPAGEGKTTISIGLGDGLGKLGKNCVLALREPSLGPVFGMKGGATGGGHAQILPMEEINLHFTGDLHAITSANNLLAAMVDNHIYHGNSLDIDPRRVVWRRCLDLNDRQLRAIVGGLGGKAQGMPQEGGFDITAASEVMAVLCLARDVDDLKARLGRIIVGYTYGNTPITCAQLNAQGAMAALLREAMRPNLVQTLEGTPALVHGGPFANIAHGCNSIRATQAALALGEYCVTEAGFGADLGAEKFLDIKCPAAGLTPDAVVVVATVRALKYHGGAKLENLKDENLAALEAGLPNLLRHADNMRTRFGLPTAVAINRFLYDTPDELALVERACAAHGVKAVLCDAWAEGGEGAKALAQEVVRLCDAPNEYAPLYTADMTLEEKIGTIATKIYGAKGVDYAPGVRTQLRRLDRQGQFGVCMAKTQYSFSSDAKKLGAPTGFTLSVRSVRLSAGAGFAVVFTGDIIAMPGMPRVPAAEGIDLTADGEITGLF